MDAMRNGRALAVIGVGAGALALAAGVAATRAVSIPSRISIAYDTQANLLSGKISSSNKTCAARRNVIVQQVWPAKKTIGRTRSDANGNWRLAYTPPTRRLARRDPKDPRVPGLIARVGKLESDVKTLRICAAAKSGVLYVQPPTGNYDCKAFTQPRPGFPGEYLFDSGDCNQPVKRIVWAVDMPITNFTPELAILDPSFRTAPVNRDSANAVSAEPNPVIATKGLEEEALAVASGSTIMVEFFPDPSGPPQIVTLKTQ